MKIIHSFIFLLIILCSSCTSDDHELTLTKPTLIQGADANTKSNHSAKTAVLQLRKVSQSVVNASSLKTLKNKRPNLFTKLTVQGNVIKASEKVSIYESDLLTVLVGNHDVDGESPEESQMVISGYEKIPIDIIGNMILFAICVCSEGSDDCKFDRNEDGSLGECNGGACHDCRGGFELSLPGGDIAEVEAAF